MTTTPPSPPKLRRRWLQFSLRTLMVLVLVACVGMGWFALEMRRARERQQAVEKIEELGGVVFFEEDHSGNTIRTAPAWLRKPIGEDLFFNVKEVDFRNRLLTDAGLRHLRGLGELQSLSLSDTQVTDAGLVQLESLTHLRELDLVGSGSVVLLGTMLYAPTARWWTRSRGEHFTLAEASGRVRLDLPDSASDIRFYQHLHPEQDVVVDFTIEEDAFLEWAARQGWKPVQVVGGVHIWPRAGFGDHATVVKVRDGLNFNTLRRGEPNTMDVTYDRLTRRAYFGLSSEPKDKYGS